jgi:hypothetical protein
VSWEGGEEPVLKSNLNLFDGEINFRTGSKLSSGLVQWDGPSDNFAAWRRGWLGTKESPPLFGWDLKEGMTWNKGGSTNIRMRSQGGDDLEQRRVHHYSDEIWRRGWLGTKESPPLFGWDLKEGMTWNKGASTIFRMRSQGVGWLGIKESPPIFGWDKFNCLWRWLQKTKHFGRALYTRGSRFLNDNFLQCAVDGKNNSKTKVEKAFFFIFMSSYAEMSFLKQKITK